MYRATKPFRRKSAAADAAIRGYVYRKSKLGAMKLLPRRKPSGTKFRKAKRIRPTRVSPKYSIGPYKGRFRNPRKRKTVSGNKATVFGTVEGENAVYLGYQSCGGRELLLRQFAEKFVMMVMREAKVSCPSRDKVIEWAGKSYQAVAQSPLALRLVFHTTASDGAITETLTDHGLHDDDPIVPTYRSFDQLVGFIVDDLKLKLTNDNVHLHSFSLLHYVDANTSAGLNPHLANRQLGDFRFTCTVKSVFKVQNITPADGTGSEVNNKNAITSNPLRGRLWHFSGGPPKIRNQFQNEITDDFMKISDGSRDDGLIVFPLKTSTCYDEGNSLHSVPKGGTLFSNVARMSGVYLPPGSFKNTTHTYRFSGTVRQFCKRMAMDTDEPFRCGDSVCVGLEPAMKTAMNEDIKIAYHVDYLSSSYLLPRYRHRLEQSNRSTNTNIGGLQSL